MHRAIILAQELNRKHILYLYSPRPPAPWGRAQLQPKELQENSSGGRRWRKEMAPLFCVQGSPDTRQEDRTHLQWCPLKAPKIWNKSNPCTWPVWAKCLHEGQNSTFAITYKSNPVTTICFIRGFPAAPAVH